MLIPIIQLIAAVLVVVSAIINLITASKKIKKRTQKIKDTITLEKPKRSLLYWIAIRIWPTTILVFNGGFLILCVLGKNIPATRFEVVLAIASVYMVSQATKYLKSL